MICRLVVATVNRYVFLLSLITLIVIHTTDTTDTSTFTIQLLTIKSLTIQLFAHCLHYLQCNTITGATYNNTICITYSTKQYDTITYFTGCCGIW